MYLDQITSEIIAARFNNKFTCIEYAGCWNAQTVSFMLWQDKTERAGVHITISNEVDATGHPPKGFKITNVQRIYTSTSNPQRNNPIVREKLPIFLT